MPTLLVGFDSAWTVQNSGAVIGVLKKNDGTYQELGPPQRADFDRATDIVTAWQSKHRPDCTVQIIDQPTIVNNETGQRPVENIVSCIVGRRFGGMQPASRSRVGMFGDAASIWTYLRSFGGASNPLNRFTTGVIETYPVLTAIALKWVRPHGEWGRLPKYNPERKKTFLLEDWEHVCNSGFELFSKLGLHEIASWLREASRIQNPRKRDQDAVDACLCLIPGLYLLEGRECLMIGDQQAGYIIVPSSPTLFQELSGRCAATGRKATGRDTTDFVRNFHW